MLKRCRGGGAGRLCVFEALVGVEWWIRAVGNVLVRARRIRAAAKRGVSELECQPPRANATSRERRNVPFVASLLKDSG